jgi:hypothetical protein
MMASYVTHKRSLSFRIKICMRFSCWDITDSLPGNEHSTEVSEDTLRKDFVLSGAERSGYNTTALVRKYLELILPLQISAEDVVLGLHWFLKGVRSGSEKNSSSTKHGVIQAWWLRRDYITVVLQTSVSTTRGSNYRLCVKPHCLRD